MHYERTPEIREKNRQASTGRKHTLKTKEKMKQAALNRKTHSMSGKHHSQETREKISRSAMGNKRAQGSRGWHHSPEARAKISAARHIAKYPPERIEKMKASMIKHVSLNLPKCKCAIHTKYHTSSLAQKMAGLFLYGFSSVIIEHKLGRYIVDAYLPKDNLVFEADGDYWHNLPDIKKHDVKRDKYIFNKFGAYTIRMTEKEINHAFAFHVMGK